MTLFTSADCFKKRRESRASLPAVSGERENERDERREKNATREREGEGWSTKRVELERVDEGGCEKAPQSEPGRRRCRSELDCIIGQD